VATLLDLLPPPPLRVLDIGCGEGRVGSELTERGYDIVGVDSDPAWSTSRATAIRHCWVTPPRSPRRRSFIVRYQRPRANGGRCHASCSDRNGARAARRQQEAGLNLDTLREISVGPWDPMSLAIRVTQG
jgi:hypothetical protein